MDDFRQTIDAVYQRDNGFIAGDVIKQIESLRSQNQLTQPNVLTLLDNNERFLNIYPHLTTEEKNMAGVTAAAIRKWRWNAAWTPARACIPLALACAKENAKNDIDPDCRWVHGHFHYHFDDDTHMYPLPGIAQITSDGTYIIGGLPKPILMMDPNSCIRLGDGDAYDILKYNEEIMMLSEDEIFGVMNRVSPVAVDFRGVVGDWNVGGVEIWNFADWGMMDDEFVPHDIQYTIKDVGGIIYNNRIFQRYMHSPGGPIERAWHPEHGKAFKKHCTALFPEQT